MQDAVIGRWPIMLTEGEVASLIADALIQVNVGIVKVAIHVGQAGAQNRDVPIGAFHAEPDILGRVAEVFKSGETKCQYAVCFV